MIERYFTCLDDLAPGYPGEALLERLWGAPTLADDPRHGGQTVRVYRNASPRVTQTVGRGSTPCLYVSLY